MDSNTTDTSFKIVVRGLYEPTDAGHTFEASITEEALRAALETDPYSEDEIVVTWQGQQQACLLDIDRPESEPELTPEEVPKLFPSTLPRPLAVWVSHGGGLHALFVAVFGWTAMALAGAWALLAPLGRLASWRIEAKADTRHPLSARNGQECSSVYWFDPSATLMIPGNSERSAASDEEIEAWLQDHGLKFGRHPAEMCLWCGGAPSSGNDPVVVDARGVRCYRCDRSATWDTLVGRLVLGDRPSLHESAVNVVHYPHQHHVLRDMRPSVPEVLLRPAWLMMLCAANNHLIPAQPSLEDLLEKHDGNQEEANKEFENLQQVRTEALKPFEFAASDKVNLVRSVSGGWLNATSFQPHVTSRPALRKMPWTYGGDLRIDEALNASPLPGFVPVHVINADTVIGPHVEPPYGAITVRRSQRACDPPPVDLGDGPPLDKEVEDAWEAVETKLPLIDRGYLSSLLVASLVAQRSVGAPPVIVVTGDTGSGKDATADLAGAMLGTPSGAVRLADADDTLRQIGLLLENGCGLAKINEVGRVSDVYWKLEAILQLSSTVTFRAKYRNETTAPMTAALVMLGSTLPHAVVRSPELSRRAAGIRLVGNVGNWRGSVGELAHARRDPEFRAALDIITSSIWWRLWNEGPSGDWRELCFREFGAVELAELDLEDVGAEGRDEAIRRLYEHYRTAPDKELNGGVTYSGYLDASLGTPAGRILADLVDFEVHHAATKAQTAELERVDLGPVLGFRTPALRLIVRRRGRTWLVKFQEIGVPKGQDLARNQLRECRRSPEEGPPDGGDSDLQAICMRSACSNPAESLVLPDLHDLHTNLSIEGNEEAGQAPIDKEKGEKPCRSGRTNNFKELPPCRTMQNGCRSEYTSSDDPIFLDFETRSLANLKEVGGRAYSRDPSTEVVCMVALLPDGTWVEWTPGQPPPEALFRAVEEGHPVAAHNAMFFDRLIWKSLGWPEPKTWVDTLHLARMAGLPGKLEEIAQRLYGEGKDKEGRTITLALSRPARRTGKLRPIDRDTLRKVVAYCRRDVELLHQIWCDRLGTLAEAEDDVRLIDQQINDRGFEFDCELARAVIELEHQAGQEALKRSDVSEDVLRSPQKLAKLFADLGVPVPNAKKGTLEALLSESDLPEPARLLILARQASSRITGRKLFAGLRACCPDGRLRDTLAYYAAHTGRWGGRRLQPQNLARGVKIDLDAAVNAALDRDLCQLREIAKAASVSVEDVLSTLVRPCIRAPKGRLLAAVDYSSIEARGLLWLAEDEENLAVFREGLYPYRAEAAPVFGLEAGELSGGQRALGKIMVLGCGYQAGPDAIRAQGEAFGIDWDASPMSPEETVDYWRDRHPLVAGHPEEQYVDGPLVRSGGLWRDLENCAKWALESDRCTEVGRCSWEGDDRGLVCVLPSGRRLVYRAAREEEVETPWGSRRAITYEHPKRGRVSIYGGKLAENITQALCRDLLADALVRIEDAGYKVVLHVHDEVVCEVDSPDDLKKIEEIMREPPLWAEGFPIDVEGYYSRRYRK